MERGETTRGFETTLAPLLVPRAGNDPAFAHRGGLAQIALRIRLRARSLNRGSRMVFSARFEASSAARTGAK